MHDERYRQHTKELINWGASVIVAEMDHYPKPFVVGLLRKCRREIIPHFSEADIDAITHDGFVAMQARKYKGKIEKPEQQVAKPKHFYQTGIIEPWMMP